MTVTDELYDYQAHAVNVAASKPGIAAFFEQGTGKTHVSAGLIERLASTDPAFTACLVVPLANIETTWAEILARIPGIQVCRNWADYKVAKGHRRVLLIHYEAMRGKLVVKVTKAKWTLVIYDESQRLKARGSKASRGAARFKDVAHRVLLSGTPIEQTPLDLWAQFRFMAPEVLGRRWADFAEKWCDATGFKGYKLKFREHMMPEFLALIEPHILRVKKEDVLDLPPLSFIRVPVLMLGEQRRVYDELERDMCTTVQGHEIIADMAITLLVRLQQVTGGFIKVDDDTTLMLGSAKRRKLKVLVDRQKLPVVIFCKYRTEVQQCMVALRGYKIDVISGKEVWGYGGRKNRTETIREFQKGKTEVLICQIRAGGVGINLFTACVGIMFSTTHSFIDFDQAISRLHRHGQSQWVKFYLLYAVNTVDGDIYDALLSKQLVSERILKRRMKMAKTSAKPAPKAATPAPKKAAPAAAPAPAAAEEKAPPAPEFKYGVKDLATALGIKEASVRVRLRNHEVEKAGKTYGWNTKAELQAVVDSIKSAPKATAEGDEPEEEAEEEE